MVITGASSGIGSATAKLFSHHGYPLLLVARRFERLEALALPRTMIAPVDISDSPKFVKAIGDAEAEFGPVGALVNNAGTMMLGHIESQDPAEWDQMFQVNVMGLLRCTRVVLKGMLERKSGTIINISSIAGRKTFPNHAAYTGTKFAVHGISESIREEVAGSNVRVTTIAPGAVETELLSHTTSDQIRDSYEDWKTSIGGALRSEDVAQSILFAYSQPQSVCVREIVIAATRQGP